MDMVQNARMASDLSFVYDLTLTLIQVTLKVINMHDFATVHFLGNLDSRKKRPEQDVCQNDRGNPPKQKTAFFQIFTDAISRNFAVTVQIGAI